MCDVSSTWAIYHKTSLGASNSGDYVCRAAVVQRLFSQLKHPPAESTLSLSSSFLFVRGEVLPATFSPPHLIFFSTLLCLSLVFFFQSSSSPAFITSLLTQSSHLSLSLPRLLLPCSRNSAALFVSLSSAILSTCPAHYSLLLTSLSLSSSSALRSLPLTPPFFSCLPYLLLLLFVPT